MTAKLQDSGLQDGRLVVAVSGGADSVALLRVVSDRFPVERLVVAHYNHRFRGAESDADAEFVASLAARLGIVLATERAADLLNGLDASSASEAHARDARYAFLERVAREAQAGAILTAHTADDQTETILHHLLRGTGLRGLRGIPFRRRIRDDSPVLLVRPLLDVSKADLTDWLRTLGQDWRTDASNASCAFTRNRLRNELLPLLRTEYHSAIDERLRRLAVQAGEVFEHLRTEAIALLEAATVESGPDVVRLRSDVLKSAARVVLREALVELWMTWGWPRQAMTQPLWDMAADVALGVRGGVDLPGGIRIDRQRDRIRVTRGGDHRDSFDGTV